ncbi:MAG: 4Fe-4S dicluster domain-containing protein [bacterium]|nr:4Fe-4S dicluster domain-containing protein [Bacillota bacterium]
MSPRRIAVIECPEEIPCNPCETVCPQGAIQVGNPITSRPRLDTRHCIGCGACVAACPGLAIFLVSSDNNGPDEVTFPYEFLPRPEPGESVTAVNRDGESLGPAWVKACWQPQGADGTYLVTITLPVGLATKARGIRRPSHDR